jgi:hypothetical protein
MMMMMVMMVMTSMMVVLMKHVCEQVVGNMTTNFGSFFSENPARVLSGTSKHANKETTKKNELNIVGDGKRDGKTKLSYQDLCTFTILQFSIVTASVFDFFVCSLARLIVCLFSFCLFCFFFLPQVLIDRLVDRPTDLHTSLPVFLLPFSFLIC